MRKTFAVLGGDLRQLRLAQLLEQDGQIVYRYGFDQEPEQSSLERAVTADVVILPLPISKDGHTLYLPFSTATIALEDLWPFLDSRRQLVCGGNLQEPLRQQASEAGVDLTDYFCREDVQIGNAVPTAEGAIQTAMEVTETTLHGVRALVTGYGRIGKVLAQDLRGLGAETVVSARKFRDAALADALGFCTLNTEALSGHLGAFDLIFNTVPAVILDRARLAELKSSCIVIDLASEPGGVDFAAVEELGVRVIWAKGLPGKVAPLSAAKVIHNAIYHILEERGEPI